MDAGEEATTVGRRGRLTDAVGPGRPSRRSSGHDNHTLRRTRPQRPTPRGQRVQPAVGALVVPVFVSRRGRLRGHDAAKESNLPSRGLPGPAGFEDRMGHQARAAPAPMLRGGRRPGPGRSTVQPRLERALDGHVEGVEPEQREGLRRGEPTTRSGRRSVVREHAVEQGELALGIKPHVRAPGKRRSSAARRGRCGRAGALPR